jgi:hypothetical protein
MLSICFLFFILQQVSATKLKVLVTGAAGKTGSLVFKKLLNNSQQFDAFGIVRNNKSVNKLLKIVGRNNKDKIVVGDVTNENSLVSSLKGVDSLILCTSAVPKIKIWSLIKAILFKIFGKVSKPEFYFQPNGRPYEVDWIGKKYVSLLIVLIQKQK